MPCPIKVSIMKFQTFALAKNSKELWEPWHLVETNFQDKIHQQYKIHLALLQVKPTVSDCLYMYMSMVE